MEAAKGEAERGSAELGKWWSAEGPKLFAELQRGLKLLAAAQLASGDWRTKSTRAGQAGHGPFAQPADRAGAANTWLHALMDACVQRNFRDTSQIVRPAARAASPR